MKKYWMILGLMLGLAGCEEANDIFNHGDNYEYVDNSIVVTQDGEEQHYEGPVYVDATSWGSIVYVNDKYVNKGVKLLISEAENAEGGQEIDVTSNALVISGLNTGVRFYYCLCMPGGKIKSNIKSVVIPDVSSLKLNIEQKGDSVVCIIQDSISSAFIQEKGFGFDYNDDVSKYIVEGEQFAFSLSDVIKKYSLSDAYLHVYAYVQTSNAYHRSSSLLIELDDISSDADADKNINTEEITISAISEETHDDGVDYLKCTVTGYVDSVYFYSDYGMKNRIYPDKKVVNDDGSITTFYVKKGFCKDIRLYAFYKVYYSENNWREEYEISDSYNPKYYKISNFDEFLDFVSWMSYSSWYWYSECTVSLLTDITLPSDMRLCIRLEHITLDGNGHTLDGVSCFPLFRELSSSTIKNLKIGTDETVYDVKKGTSSLSTTDAEVPRYFLSNDYIYDVTFENCEIRGTFKVTGRDDFNLLNISHGWEEDSIAGLKDYTKTEYVTTTND